MEDRTDHSIREIWGEYQCTLKELKSVLEDEYGIKISKSSLGRRMKKLGIKPIGRPFGAGVKIICSDGHRVDSYEEARVDEWLSELEINHWIHHKIAGTNCTIDFWLPEYKAGIEVAGMIPNSLHIARYEEKKEIYRELNIPVLFIVPKDELNTGLLEELSKLSWIASRRREKDLLVLHG